MHHIDKWRWQKIKTGATKAKTKKTAKKVEEKTIFPVGGLVRQGDILSIPKNSESTTSKKGDRNNSEKKYIKFQVAYFEPYQTYGLFNDETQIQIGHASSAVKELLNMAQENDEITV